MESSSFINWVEEWKSRVTKQSIQNNKIRQTGMTTILDQGIGFDQEGLPYELNNPPPHVCDRSDPPLKDERSEPTLKGGRCSSGFEPKYESTPAPGSGGNGEPPSGDLDDPGDDGSDSSGSDSDDSHSGDNRSSGPDSYSIRGSNPSNVCNNTRETLQPGNLDVNRIHGRCSPLTPPARA